MRRPIVREELRGTDPARTAQGKKTFEETPRGFVMHRVVREPADGLVLCDISHCQPRRFVAADEALAVVPGDDVDLSIDLRDAGNRLLVTIAAEAPDAGPGRLRGKLAPQAVPRRRDDRQALAAAHRDEPRMREAQALERLRNRL